MLHSKTCIDSRPTTLHPIIQKKVSQGDSEREKHNKRDMGNTAENLSLRHDRNKNYLNISIEAEDLPPRLEQRRKYKRDMIKSCYTLGFPLDFVIEFS